jgi:hypothetical protein
MSIHTDLPIYRTGTQLLSLAVKVQEQMPRGVKRSLGDKISGHCMEMLDRMAMANASQRGERAAHINVLMQHLRATTVLLRVCHDSRYVSHGLWAQSVLLLDSIGRQGGGWLKSASNRAPAA